MKFQRKQRIAFFLLMAALCLILFVRSSAFASIRSLARGAYYAASNGREQFRYTGRIKATVKGKPALALSIRSLMKENQILLFVGRLLIKGQITPDASGALLPSKLRLSVIHKNASGTPLRTTSFEVNVQSNGAILMQNVPFSTFDLINPKELLDLSVTPVDRNLPAGSIILNVTHTIGSAATAKAMAEQSVEERAGPPPKFAFVFNNFLSGHPKNQVIGPLLLKVPSDLHYFALGTLHVQGKITPEDPGGLPNRFQMVLKHKLQQGGKLLKTEMFNVNVQSDGRILLQNFPVNGNTDVASPDQLEVSMKYLDKNIPDREVNVTISFSPAPPAP